MKTHKITNRYVDEFTLTIQEAIANEMIRRISEIETAKV